MSALGAYSIQHPAPGPSGSAHDTATRSYSLPETSASDTNGHKVVNHRTRSAPPKISTANERNRQESAGKELCNLSNTQSSSRINLGNSFCCSRFRHADFEVAARNLPMSRLQELDNILSAFASSSQLSGPTPARLGESCHYSGLKETERVRSKQPFVTSNGGDRMLCKDHILRNSIAGGGSMRGDGGHSSRVKIRLTEPCERHIWERDCVALHAHRDTKNYAEFGNNVGPPTRIGLLPQVNNDYSSSACRRQSGCMDEDEFDSDAFVDFLHFARERDPDPVSALELEYDNMADQLGDA